MHPSDFSDAAPGRVIRVPSGYWAFLPDPLPPEIAADWELAGLAAQAHGALGELAGVVRTLPNPLLLVAPFIRREAVLSSRIEGTRASLTDLLLFEAAPRAHGHDRDEREVANYVDALEYGLARLETMPLSLRLLREMHARLHAGLGAEHLTPGEFRRSQNWIGRPGSTIAGATYVPPPAAEMLDALDALERHIHTASPLAPLIRIALIHYQFEAIHPFLDGNGRIGRMLIGLLLKNWGLLPVPVLPLSAYFEQTRPRYYRHLTDVSHAGDWHGWLAYFLEGVRHQAADALQRATRLLDLREAYRGRRESARSGAVLLRILDNLFTAPAVTVPQIAERLGVTQRAARQNVDRLVAEGILREVTGRQRNRIYLAHEIIAIVDTEAMP